MLQLEVLVRKLVAVDGFAPGAVMVGEVSALDLEKKSLGFSSRSHLAEAFQKA